MANRFSQGLTDQGKSEIQLTLLFDPSSYSQVIGLPWLQDGWEGPQESQLTATYFDGPDWPLANSNVYLWVEREGRSYRQHLEAAVSRVGIATVLKVWQSPITTSYPTLTALADQGLPELLGGLSANTLKPFCHKKLKRMTHQMRLENRGNITAVIEFGELIVGSTKAPVGELNLKLESSPSDLPFELCLRIGQQVPLRISGDNSAKTALALLPGQTPRSRKAQSLNLSRDATVDGALSHTIQECLNHISANEACLLESEDPEAVHQMRVAVRRFRSALRVYRPLLPPDQYAWLNGELRRFAEQLGSARDWDVFADEIAKPAIMGRMEDKAFQTFRDLINEVRTASRLTASEAVRSKRYTTFLLRSSAWLANSAWRNQPVSETSALLFGPVRAFADDRRTKFHEPVWSAGGNFETLSVKERHQLRICVKRLRYATEFFSSIYPRKAVKRYCGKLAGLQDALGYLNDVAVSEDLVRRICADCTGEDLGYCQFAGGIVIGWHARALADSEQKLVKRVRSFVESKPFWLPP